MSVPLRFTILLYSAALAISLSVAALLPHSKLEAMSPESFSISEKEEAPTTYILKAEKGEICIFEGQQLIQKTGVAVASLPAEDRFSLETGISASSQEALTALLEDLCS
ncbi:MAG: hypothetical protein MJ077_04425 [Oscillospiraceae bacterium]|nr:hypothetical protein [Oscillospiraceae bacterium]